MFYKGEIPFVRLLFPLICGITFAYWFPGPFILQWSLAAAWIILAILGFLVVKYKTYTFYRSSWIIGVVIHLLIMLTGYALTVYQSGRYDKRHFSRIKPAALIVQISSEPKLSNGILRFESEVHRAYAKDKQHATRGKLLTAIQTGPSPLLRLNYGDLLLIPGRFNAIEPSYNPGEFDYKGYLANRQVHHQAFIYAAQVQVIKRDAGNPIISYSLSLRQELVQKFYHYLNDNESAAFASTLILGDRADLSRELVSAYSKTGTMHVLSVSGMHVGIIFLVLSGMLKPMDRTKTLRLIRAVSIIAIIWFYAMLTGFSAPVCRAAVMLSFIVIGKAINRSQNTYNLISISAFFLLLYEPFYLANAGFQLSYLAVAGLVYFHPRIYQTIVIRNRIIDYAWSYCALSVAAQLATFPISLYYFHQFPVYFLFSNLFLVLPIAVIMYAGIIFLFIPYGIISDYLGYYLNVIIAGTNHILYEIADLPFSSWRGICINTFEYLLIYGILACVILRLSYKVKNIYVPMLSLVFILTLSAAIKGWKNAQTHELIFFSLRKNFAVAYLHQGKATVFSDVNASDKLFSYSITPSLEINGIKTLKLADTSRVFSGLSFRTDAHYLQFADYRIMRWDKSYDGLEFAVRLKVDMVLLSGSPRSKLSEIARVINFETVVLDGTNPDYKIRAWKEEAGSLGIPCYDVKKNPAYIVKL